jgi:putative membrane protein
MDWGGFGWVFGGFFSLIFLIIIILVILWAVRQGSGGPGWSGRENGRNALDIARERYARGEITAAEFEEIKRNLT